MYKYSFVYIMTNQRNTVLYTGVTSNLSRRVFQHKSKMTESFTKRYNVDKLVYFERFSGIGHAIAREKQIKNYSRKKKLELIESMNENWEDLYESIID